MRNIQHATNLDFEVQELGPTIDKVQAANQSQLFHQEQLINDLSYDVWAKERDKKDEKQDAQVTMELSKTDQGHTAKPGSKDGDEQSQYGKYKTRMRKLKLFSKLADDEVIE